MVWKPDVGMSSRACSTFRYFSLEGDKYSEYYTKGTVTIDLVDRVQNGQELFVILDEILKGTNSKDKARGSFDFLKKMISLKGTGVVATHDLSLCEIENEFPEHIQNLYFNVELGQEDLVFDYILRPGICSTMNATYLMKKMGITE